jgi:hypothetical protein
MRKGTIYFFTLFISINYTAVYTFAQIRLKAQGIVLSNADKSAIEGASVTLRILKDSTIIAYTITKQDGSFEIDQNLATYEPVFLEVSHISYENKRRTLYPETKQQSLINFSGIVFLLTQNTSDLKKIIINSTARPVTIHNDTIEYNVKFVKGPEIKKVEDLIKELQGFSVDATGSIMYNGKQVEKILIEGEDLADNSYKLISKNLDAGFIDKVQVIKNYNDNRLLRGVEQSDKVGINLKISSEFKNKLSTGIDIGASNKGNQDIDQNSIYVTKGIKLLGLLNYNSIGKISNKDIRYFYNQGDSYSDTFDDIDQANLIKPGKIYMPDLPDPYRNNNNNFTTALMGSQKFGKSIKLKFLSGYTTSTLRNSEESIVQTTISLTEKWAIGSYQSSGFTDNSLATRIGLQHDNSGNNVGLYKLDLTDRNSNNLYNEITNGAVIDTLREQLMNRSIGFHLTGNETFKINRNSILQIDLKFGRERNPQDYQLSTERLLNFFKADSSYTVNRQKTSSIVNTKELSLKYAAKKNSFSYTIGLMLSENKNEYVNDISLSSVKVGNIDSMYPSYLATPEIVKLGLFGLLTKRVGRKTIINVAGAWGQSRLSVINKKYISQPIFNSLLEIKRTLSDFKSLSFQFSLKQVTPDLSYFSPQTLISGDVSIIRPTHSTENILIGESSVTYVAQNMIRNSQFFASTTFRRSVNEYNFSGFHYPEYSIYSFTPLKNNASFWILANGEKYIAPIKSKVIIRFQESINSQTILLNSNPRDNISHSSSLQLKFISSFKWPVNFELSSKIQYFQNRFLNEAGNDNNFLQYENSIKMKLTFSEKLYAAFFYDYFMLSKESKFNTQDLYASYKLKKSLSFSVTIHNLINADVFSQKSISPSTISINSFRVVPGYFLGKISFHF